jgi:hypothetical protein
MWSLCDDDYVPLEQASGSVPQSLQRCGLAIKAWAYATHELQLTGCARMDQGIGIGASPSGVSRMDAFSPDTNIFISS